MPTLTATVGGASSNSYVATADGDTYFDERLNASAWTDADADDKERAVIMATRRLDQEDYRGEKNTTGQALKWPRIAAFDEDGEEYASDAIPEFLKQATYELALRFLNDGTTDTLADTGLEQFKTAKVGPLEVEINHAQRAGELPENVHRLIRHVLMTTRASGRTWLA